MGTQWVLNMAGATLTEEKMNDIPHATTELYIHVVTKSVQMFSILGLGVAGPITAVVKGNKNWAGIKVYCVNCLNNDFVIECSLNVCET